MPFSFYCEQVPPPIRFGRFSGIIEEMFIAFSEYIVLLCGLLAGPAAFAEKDFPAILEAPSASGVELPPPNKRIGDVYEMVYQIKTATDARAPKASYGSSFVVGKDGLLATNFHVVSSALFEPERYRLFLVDGEQSIEAKVVAFDVVNDLALVRVSRDFSRSVTIAYQPPHVGSKIYSIGLPEDLNKSIIEGNFNGIVTEGPYQKAQMSIPLNPGMSGGPTVDEAGRLIGVNVSLRLESQSLAFSVPAQLLKLLLKKPSVDYYGPNSRKMIDEETRRQLEEIQEDLTKIVTKGKQDSVKMHGWVASRPSQYLKCWRETEAPSRNRSMRTKEICYLPNSTNLKSNVDLGTLRLRFHALTGSHLNMIQFLEAANQSILQHNLDTVEYIEGFTTKFHCEQVDLVNSYAVPLRVQYCFNGFLKYPGLYNLELRAVTLTQQKSIFQVQASLSAFSASNALEIGRQIIDSIHSEPAL